MDKEVLKQALDEMRREMRARVGKKLLSIEVHQHTDGDPTDNDDADGSAQPDDGKDPVIAKKMGLSII